MPICPPVNIRPLTCDDQVSICSVVDSAVLSSVAASITSVVLVAANPLRKSLILFNDSSSTIYIAYAPVSSNLLYTHKLIGNEGVELPLPIFNGTISGIWESAIGSIKVTEMT